MSFWKTGFCRRAGHCMPVSGFLSNLKDNWISLLLSALEMKKEDFFFSPMAKTRFRKLGKRRPESSEGLHWWFSMFVCWLQLPTHSASSAPNQMCFPGLSYLQKHQHASTTSLKFSAQCWKSGLLRTYLSTTPAAFLAPIPLYPDGKCTRGCK